MKVIWVKQTRALNTRRSGPSEMSGEAQGEAWECLGKGRNISNLDKMKYKRTFRWRNIIDPV